MCHRLNSPLEVWIWVDRRSFKPISDLQIKINAKFLAPLVVILSLIRKKCIVFVNYVINILDVEVIMEEE